MRTRIALTLLSAAALALTQQRLPNYGPYRDAQPLREALRRTVNAHGETRFNGYWADPNTIAYRIGTQLFVAKAPDFKPTTVSALPPAPPAGPRTGGGPGRGRQFTTLNSPDGTATASYANGNLALKEGTQTVALTTEGDEAKGLKFGSASWVYGEELSQNEAFGFSPNSRFLWYYRFDESQVPIYTLVTGLDGLYGAPAIERYPKPGSPNPIVDLYVFDRNTRKTTKVNVRPGAFENGIGHYVFDIDWTPDNRLIFRRSDRRQQNMELCLADPITGSVAPLIKESNSNGWVEYDWPLTWLPDGKRALWISESTGFANFVLINLDTPGQTRPLTNFPGEVRNVLPVRPGDRDILFQVFTGNKPGLIQLGRVNLDGTNPTVFTDPNAANRGALSPDGKHLFVVSTKPDLSQTVSVHDRTGKRIQTLANTPALSLAGTAYRLSEDFQFTAADGKTVLNGRIHFPPNFNPARKYPVLAEVYGGPLGATSTSWNMGMGNIPGSVDLGFLVIELENRGLQGRGREFKNALYRKMGQTEIDDLALGLKAVLTRPYADATRTAISGTSYGGYASIMSLVRYPDLWRAALVSSCVSDWRQYDTTYTERYMDLLENNPEGYRLGSALTYAEQMKGWALIYYGTSDDNTHPNNALSLIRALQRANKTFEVQVGPNAGHTAVNWMRGMEFLIERLNIEPRLPNL